MNASPPFRSILVRSVALAWLLAWIGHSQADPLPAAPGIHKNAARSVRGAAYELLKSHLGQYDGKAFMDKSSLGGMMAYRRALSSEEIRMDPKLTGTWGYGGSNTGGSRAGSKK